MKKLFTLFSLAFLLAGAAHAEPHKAYDENADAKAQLQQALQDARASHRNVLVIFGANWCKDCLELDKAIKGHSAALIAKKFVLVKVDVGQFDKNLDLAEAYGNPIKKGIPGAVLLKPDNTLIYATRAGELSNARHMGDQGIYDFFAKVAP